MKKILALIFITTMSLITFSQDVQKTTYSYAYISVEKKGFTKLKVTVDLGDTPEQKETGEEYSTILTDKESYSAILNYMGEREYELVETRDANRNLTVHEGVGKTSRIKGDSGIIFIMRKKNTY